MAEHREIRDIHRAPRRPVRAPMRHWFGAFGDRSHFSDAKSERESRLRFRAAEQALRDTVAWYKENGCSGENSPICRARAPEEPASC